MGTRITFLLWTRGFERGYLFDELQVVASSSLVKDSADTKHHLIVESEIANRSDFTAPKGDSAKFGITLMNLPCL
jgi:hypothetical protein